jgi:hypothetical protein
MRYISMEKENGTPKNAQNDKNENDAGSRFD